MIIVYSKTVSNRAYRINNIGTIFQCEWWKPGTQQWYRIRGGKAECKIGQCTFTGFDSCDSALKAIEKHIAKNGGAK